MQSLLLLSRNDPRCYDMLGSVEHLPMLEANIDAVALDFNESSDPSFVRRINEKYHRTKPFDASAKMDEVIVEMARDVLVQCDVSGVNGVKAQGFSIELDLPTEKALNVDQSFHGSSFSLLNDSAGFINVEPDADPFGAQGSSFHAPFILTSQYKRKIDAQYLQVEKISAEMLR